MAVFHFYGNMFHCLNMVKIDNVNKSDLKDTGIIIIFKILNKTDVFYYFPIACLSSESCNILKGFLLVPA